MAKANKAGAKAFAEYYWEVVNYAQATGDVATLETLYSAACEPCAAGPRQLVSIYDAGGVITGGDYRVGRLKLNLSRTPSGAVASAQMRLSASAQVVSMPGRPEEEHPSASRSLRLLLTHTETGWLISQWEHLALEP